MLLARFAAPDELKKLRDFAKSRNRVCLQSSTTKGARDALKKLKPQPEEEDSRPEGGDAPGTSSSLGVGGALGEPKAAERKQETVAERRKRMAGLREEKDAERYRAELLAKHASTQRKRNKEEGGATGG